MRTSAWMYGALLAAAGAAWLPATAFGQAWPSRPVTMIVPFPAGTSPDIVARYLSVKLQEQLGQPFIVDNRAGAGGAIGAEAAARAAPDGHTHFFLVNSIVTMNQFIYRKLNYDPARDFAPVSMVAAVPYVLLAHKDVPYRTLKDLIAAAKAKPGSIDYASAGIGGAGHVIVELFGSLAGIQLTHIPYKAGGLAAVIGGQVPLMLQPTTTALAQVQKGALIALGTTSVKRLPTLPDVPSIAEVVPGFAADGWQGLMVPAGTPLPAIERTNRSIASILALAETKERFTSLGIEPWSSTPQQMAKVIEQDTEKWGKVIRNARIEAQ
jgi:tripartite-type tricarboxylate transporter receptor subunit TctC